MELIKRCIIDSLRYWKGCRTEIVAAVTAISIFSGVYWIIMRKRNVENITLRSFLPKVFLWILDSVYIIYSFYVTLGMRYIGYRQEVSLIPLYSLITRPGEIPLMVENVLLFIPYGILAPMSCKKLKNGKSVLFSAAIISIFIELLQYAFQCGKTEIDDWILNCFGAGIGYLIYIINSSIVVENKEMKNM